MGKRKKLARILNSYLQPSVTIQETYVIVDALLAELREPTEEMLRAGCKAGTGHEGDLAFAEPIWQAMLDKAGEEKGDE